MSKVTEGALMAEPEVFVLFRKEDGKIVTAYTSRELAESDVRGTHEISGIELYMNHYVLAPNQRDG